MAARRALIVIGMHRSGTSALTRMLNLLGAKLPSELLQLDPDAPNETNELGFWEGLEVNTLNNEFLASIGSSWDDTARIPDAVFRSDAALAMRDRIVRHLEVEFADAPLFAVKDPRIARLAPLWIDAIKAFGAEPNFILAFRNPLEVAQSLRKRDEMGGGQAAILWLRYTLEAERNTRNFRRSFVPYEALLENWRGAARRIAEDCGFAWPRFNAAAELAVDTFVSADRRHNSASKRQWDELPQWSRDVHDVFQRGAEDGACFDVAVVDRVLSELDTAGAVFDRYICELDFKLKAQTGELQSVQSQYESFARSATQNRDELESLLTELQSDRDHLHAEAQRLVAERESEHISRVALEEQSRGLEVSLAARDGEITYLQGELDAANAVVQELQAQAGHLLTELETGRTSHGALEAQSRGLEVSLAARDGEITYLQGELDAANAVVQELQAQAGHLLTELETGRTSHGALEGQSRLLEASLAAKSAEVARLEGELEAAGINAQKLLASEQERHQLEQRLRQAEAEARAALVLRRRLEEANDQSDYACGELERRERVAQTTHAALAATKITLSATIRKLQAKTSEADTAVAGLAATRFELDLANEGLRERDDLKRQLQAITASRTWRLAAPIRQLVSKTKTTFSRGPS